MTRPKSNTRDVLAVYLGAHRVNSKADRYTTGAEVHICYIKGNSAPYFSVTGFTTGICGCCHEDLLKRWPELRPIIDLHLSDDTGMPMYAVENGYYWLQQGNVQVLAEYLRISLDRAEKLVTDYALKPFSKQWFADHVVEPERIRYFKEAIAAMELIRQWQKNHPAKIDKLHYQWSLSRNR